ncbi:uncharacterized protein DS421_20g704280 [Arachis hypogaea]|nr:uncharacterized protein DS421_20g704280 [Arachis hypogaea]
MAVRDGSGESLSARRRLHASLSLDLVLPSGRDPRRRWWRYWKTWRQWRRDVGRRQGAGPSPPVSRALSSRSELPSPQSATAATVAVAPTAPPPSSPLYFVFLLLLLLSFMKKEQKETVRAMAAGLRGKG